MQNLRRPTLDGFLQDPVHMMPRYCVWLLSRHPGKCATFVPYGRWHLGDMSHKGVTWSSTGPSLGQVYLWTDTGLPLAESLESACSLGVDITNDRIQGSALIDLRWICRVVWGPRCFPTCAQTLPQHLAVGSASTMTLSNERRRNQVRGSTRVNSLHVESKLFQRRRACPCIRLAHLIETRRPKSTCPESMKRGRKAISRLGLRPPSRCGSWCMLFFWR